ncbi:MAG: fibronectin type III domain-containing protein [Weeksellaceae bacterium]
MAVSAAVLFYFTSSGTPTRASKLSLQKQEVVNVTPTQVGIYWQSSEADQGWVIYGTQPDQLNNIARDEQDKGSEPGVRVFHYAILKNLQADSTLYYRIISNNQVISTPDDAPFETKTARDTSIQSSLSPSYGKLVSAQDTAVKNAHVFLYYPNAYPLFALTGETGEWLIPLQFVTNKQDRTQVSLQESTQVRVEILHGESKSVIDALLEQTHPLPETTVLGEDASFLEKTEVLSATSNTTTQSTQTARFELLYPKQNATIPGTAPLIRGKGIANKVVNASINSRPAFSGQATVDSRGDWNIGVNKVIAPGSYTLIVTTTDQNNRAVREQRTFTIIKSGEQVLAATATPSGTLTPTVRLSPSVTPRISITAILSPTLNLSPTPTVIAGIPTATPAPPVSGVNMVPYFMAGMGLVIVGLGLVMIL